GDQTIDQVKIVAMQDMQVRVDAPVESDFAACNLTGRSLKVYLENLTGQEVPFRAGDSVTVEMSGASNFVLKQALSGRLESRELDSLVLSPIDYVGGGQFDVKVYVNAIDSNASNDTAKFSLNLNPDLAVTRHDAIGYTEPGDTVYVGFTMKNIGNLDIVSPIEVLVVLNMEDTVRERISRVLKPGDTLYHRFSQGIIVPVTTSDQPFYLLDVYAQMPCDANGDNDSVRITGLVNVVDNGILSIITPAATPCAMGGSMAKVEVRLFNNGTVDNTDSLLLTAVIDSAGVAYATMTEKIAPMYGGENRNHTFSQSYRVPRLSVNGAQAAYKVTVFLGALADDIDHGNDTAKVEACVEGGVGIEDATADRWTVGQNVPNPASELTRLPYVIPEAGVLTLRIMGMNGQVLYREDVNAEAGSGDIRVNLSDLAAGVYYYSVEYRGERVVKKMNVVR
ncbi:MAG: T9SS type A sorting domain-containing protein, partial [Bacteroidales bacterium]|nr:T9SS type A sorting domain-containing protein [Bacteroidales bacterium]